MRKRLPVIGGLLLSAICLASIASAQTNWQRTYGGVGDERGHSVQQTGDGGYVIAGYTYSYGAGGSDVYLIKTNARGDSLWTRTYGGPSSDFGHSVQLTADGGYIIAGTTWSFGAGSGDLYLVKTGTQGDTLWTKTYGGPGWDEGYSAQQTTDGGYVIAGYTRSFGAGQTDFYLVRTNAQGDTLWTGVYGGPGYDQCYSVQETDDGGYILAGYANLAVENEGVCLIKTNASGDATWARTYGGSFCTQGNSVQETSDGGYIFAGCHSGSSAYLVKANAQGDSLWTRTYGGWNVDEGRSVRQTNDGGYMITGNTASFGAGDHDVYAIKTNAQGDTVWTRTYGGPSYDIGSSVQQTADGSYIIAGYTASFRAGDADVYLIKTNGKLDVGPLAILSPPGIADSGNVYLPRAVVRNYGLTSGSIFQVTMNIGSGYSQTVQETLVSVPLDTLVFPPWTAEPVGSVAVRCFTSLVGDEAPANDTISDSIEVLAPPWHDVGATAIVSPPGSVRVGDTVIPRALVRNFGNVQERFFDVRFRIGDGYNEKVNVADALPAGSTAELVFPAWVTEAGNWAVSCSTMLGSDADKTNDKVSSSVQVVPQSLSIESDQSDRIEAGKSKTYRFYAFIQGDTGAVVEVTRPSPPPGWSVRLCDSAGTQDLTDTDADGTPDLGYVAQGESSWFSLEVTAPSGTQGDTASLGQGVFVVAGQVGGRPDIADTAVLRLTLVPAFSVHNFPNPFSDHTVFVVGLPEDGKASLTVYTRTGERICRVLAKADLSAGVHFVDWPGVNEHGRAIAPGTYEYLLDYVHGGKTDRIRKKLVLTRE